MKNSKTLALFLCFTLILGLSFAVAEGDKIGKNNSNEKSLNILKRSNYGSCVSDQTKVKNSCYKQEKTSYKNCASNVKEKYKNQEITNKTQIKNMKTECRNDYKQKMNQCKSSFKSNKENCESLKPDVLTSESCTAGGGRWNECGSKCAINSQGKQDVACPTVCETICECGTIVGLTCPSGYICNIPKNIPDAMGYCK